MKVFIDTNIMVDVLLGRKEFLLQSSTYSNLPITRMLNFTQQLLLLSTHCMFPE